MDSLYKPVKAGRLFLPKPLNAFSAWQTNAEMCDSLQECNAWRDWSIDFGFWPTVGSATQFVLISWALVSTTFSAFLALPS